MNLNPSQFHQPEFPGMPPRLAEKPRPPEALPERPSSAWNSTPEEQMNSPEYSSAHVMAGNWVDNPLYPGVQRRGLSELAPGHSGTEFIPVPHIVSGQRDVNKVAVDHQVKYADPMSLRDDPLVAAVKGPAATGLNAKDLDTLISSNAPHLDDFVGVEELFDVRDGNHRVNAALRRGQLFMPAKVMRAQGPKREGGPDA